MTLIKYSLLDVCIKVLTVCIKVCIISISEHTRKGLEMAKVRVNISIDEQVLNDLDWYAEKRGINRSQAIADMVALESSMKDDNGLVSVWDFICELDNEIDAMESYEESEFAKRGAFYQLMGYVKAMVQK